MLSYKPETFASLYESDVGQRLWTFLILPETIALLETTSELGKPAVEGIEEQLLEAFRDEILADRVEQMIRHIVRQIMEHRGWVLDRSEVKVQSMPFTKAPAIVGPTGPRSMLSAIQAIRGTW
jgi:hypothetical protein